MLSTELHTDALESRFGPIAIQLVQQDQRCRIVHLLDARGISRTLAVTLFSASPPSDAIARLLAQLRQGGGLGRTFRDAGFRIDKPLLAAGLVALPPWLQAAFASAAAVAAARLYGFGVQPQGEEAVKEVGRVLEVLHPELGQLTVTGRLPSGLLTGTADAAAVPALLRRQGF